MPGRPRIFCIGLNKTGTRSLHLALELLGYRSLHWGGPPVRMAVERAAEEGVELLRYVEDHDAYSDILALSQRYALLDEQYPGSRFILTIRPLEPWLGSRRAHVEQNIANHAAGTYTGNFLEIDLDAWTAEWHEHHAGIRAYFAGRPHDLLEMDISRGDGWEVLCPFLDRPAPGDPFPHVTHRA